MALYVTFSQVRTKIFVNVYSYFRDDLAAAALHKSLFLFAKEIVQQIMQITCSVICGKLKTMFIKLYKKILLTADQDTKLQNNSGLFAFWGILESAWGSDYRSMMLFRQICFYIF